MGGGGGRGGRGEPAAPTTGQAIQNLRETEDMLIKKQEFLEHKIEAQVQIAKKNAKTNKRVALNVRGWNFTLCDTIVIGLAFRP